MNDLEKKEFIQWVTVINQLQKLGVITPEDRKSSTQDVSTPGRQLLANIRTWGESRAKLAVSYATASPDVLIDAVNQDLDEEVKDLAARVLKATKGLTLLYFTAKSCGPCQAIKKAGTLEKLQRIMPELEIRTVDVEKEDAIADAYDVQSMPCWALIRPKKKGKRGTDKVAEYYGVLTAPQLAKWIGEFEP